MAGRFGYFMIGGAAIFAGMAVQGDFDLGDDDMVVHRVEKSDRADRNIDRRVDRAVDRAARKIDRAADGRDLDSATESALAAAVAELARAEGSLIAARLDDDLPATAIERVEKRRDTARQEVDRIAADIRTRSRSDRDARRQTVRDDVRETIRDAVRS